MPPRPAVQRPESRRSDRIRGRRRIANAARWEGQGCTGPMGIPLRPAPQWVASHLAAYPHVTGARPPPPCVAAYHVQWHELETAAAVA